jgi:NADH dehydrogenase/NADH:ubiquinone oxidoreductase subunit G
VRKNGALKAATWDEALSEVASHFKDAADNLAAVVSSRQPIEALYGFKQLFADKLGSNLVTSTEEGLYTADIAAYAESKKKALKRISGFAYCRGRDGG